MSELQTPTQNPEPSTPNAPKHRHVYLPDYRELSPACLIKALPSTREKCANLKSLVVSSEPDYYTPSFTYLGPPIGFSAKIIEHHTPSGVITTSVYGSLMAPRPRLTIPCDDRWCSTCRTDAGKIAAPRRYTLVASSDTKSPSPRRYISSESTTPTLRTPIAREYASRRSPRPLNL
ncbi:hypothetical protein DOTSEDRAFT_30857 [Dothistroma septosporum NZE10]|uniref:Uncharacterized protein n=1 Tax=Dothistroma septosporum (strain NZE10 / CBS 128990) TaxID=675120 RepID=N1Q1Q7_DOTSN|nr:hypothetical protein DOTSEDRAFT_30857 [Dothistroma septosporum NZE10]